VSSPSKRKGSAFELEIVKYLNDAGWPYAERRLAGDQYDKGDITGTPAVVWECKNQKTFKLAEWVDELTVEMRTAKAPVGAVIHKRRGTTSAADYYATLPLSVYCQLLKEAGY
jgi:hypothetical protein